MRAYGSGGALGRFRPGLTVLILHRPDRYGTVPERRDEVDLTAAHGWSATGTVTVRFEPVYHRFVDPAQHLSRSSRVLTVWGSMAGGMSSSRPAHWRPEENRAECALSRCRPGRTGSIATGTCAHRTAI